MRRLVRLARDGRVKAALAAAAILLASGLAVAVRGCGHGPGSVAEAGVKYQCPMHPQIVQDHPGSCPICHMDLVRVAAGTPEKNRAAERAPFGLSERRQQLIGVKWQKVEERALTRHIRLPGRVTGPGTVSAELLEIDAGTVREGMKARITGPQDQAVDAEVSGVDPAFDSLTRSYTVALQATGGAGWLKAGVYCEVSVKIEYGKRLAVPAEAVLYGGEHRVVFVTDGKGWFKPVEVRLGKNGEDWIEVLSGVKEGDRVVTSANFLVDSESRFKAALEQF
jgi:multidrug efflux pump subunit AcrA (membrane-fusion protein)